PSYKMPRMCSTGNAMMKYGAMIHTVHIHGRWRSFCLSSSAAMYEAMGVSTGSSLKMNIMYRLVLSHTSGSITVWDRSKLGWDWGKNHVGVKDMGQRRFAPWYDISLHYLGLYVFMLRQLWPIIRLDVPSPRQVSVRAGKFLIHAVPVSP